MTSKVRQAKYKYLHSTFQNYQSDQKHFVTLSLIKSILSMGVDKQQIRLTLNNMLIAEEGDVTIHFNEVLSEVADNIHSNLRPAFISDPLGNIPRSMHFSPVSREECLPAHF